VLTKLGGKDVSSTLLVEKWKAGGRECDEIFFMHFDVLFEYRFLQHSDSTESPVKLDELMACQGDTDRLVSITHEGSEFLHCFGGR